MPELLLELFSEEIPARMQRAAAEGLKTLVMKRLADAGLAAESGAGYVTPRRLTVHLTGVPAQQPDRREERKGPRVGAPEAAVNGFLKAAGLTSLDQAEQRDAGKGAFWFAVSEIKGRPSADVLPELLAGAVLALSWPKSMRWRDTRLAWVRPLHSMIGLFDGRPLGGGLQLGANRAGGAPGGYVAAGAGDANFVGFGRRTRGHRFLAPDAIEVDRFADYRDRLTAAFVEIDPLARRDRIQRQAEQLAASHQLTLIEDPGLLDEVAGLVEWPTALIGRIDDAFMGVPPEVLTTAMRTHQKYFALRRRDGALAPHFIVVSNMVTDDGGAAIIAGNERVLRARLSDAKFFWDLDRKTPLARFADKLDQRVFHAKLGTVADKVARIEALAGDLAERMKADRGQAMIAARLAKADLSSGMVGEFPELQGVMGRYYALAESQPAAVADAIAQHYAPAGPDDSCPSAPISVAVALADKIDTLAGFFAIDERPTGSKDPFALRRAALGILRIIAENGLRLPMRPLFEQALARYGKKTDGALVDALLGFLADRLKVYLRGAQVRHDLVEAVFRLREDDFVRLRKRVDALGPFVGSETGQSLLVAFRRAVNILRIEEKKDGRDYTGPALPELMRQPEETALKQALDAIRPAAMQAIAADDFVGAMTRLGGLRGPVDAFFEAVTVNCPETDLRQNRLRLLSDIRDTFLEVADFSAIEEPPTMASTVTTKWVYSFGDSKAEGRADMRNLLGGKGANLAEMSHLGLPVPPGFTITTEVCTYYYGHERRYPDALKDEVAAALTAIERAVSAKFGAADQPLLVSVRSGARASMPGMMDTVLNLGLNDETVAGLAKLSGDARFAYDSYRRFIQMYSNVVLGIEHHHFEDILNQHKDDRGVSLDTELDAEDWQGVVGQYMNLVRDQLGHDFPQDPAQQLWGAIGAVFGSWMNQRAIVYRRLHDIPESWGTAVTVQAMVFGNMGDDCATGVAFTRNPSTGENEFYGEYLVNAQGEDVVAGIRTPQQLTLKGKQANRSTMPALEEAMPATFSQLLAVRNTLEQHYRDVQDIEFTVQQGKLFMLQTRTGKRTAAAALKIAVDMAREGLIDEAEAVKRVEPRSLDQILHPTLDPKAPRTLLARGLPASPGAASGKVVFSADAAEDAANRGEPVILVRVETSPEDIHGMHAAKGILTTRGGMTSHAAVVARGMGRPCVSGAGDLRIDYAAGILAVRHHVVRAGDKITIDGATGEVFAGEVATIQPELSGDFATLMGWADRLRTLGVRANAETVADATTALRFGAEGIGLCRTEHMFFDAERITAVRQMIVADDEKGRRAALAKILPMQRGDFAELFRAMKGLPVTIRLLDPPLHEFLPHTEAEIAEVARAAGVDPAQVRNRAQALHEVNPMLGHRGCRLGITYPEIYEMQVRAIFEAVVEVQKDLGATVKPEIMIPLIATKKEFDILKDMVVKVASEVALGGGITLDYLVGTMIELPRAALAAGKIAETAEFFSYGTNDLTQTAFGLSRDDAGAFLQAYVRKGILDEDPFVTLDQEGVGELVRIATERGRATRPDLKLGICGEHGGDPASIRFCHDVGLDYVSCSPFRVPIARLAAAQAALASGINKDDL